MKKILIQGVITIALFFATWFLLIQIDWVAIFKIQKVTDETEEKIGELFWDMTQSTENENNSPLVKNTMDSLVTKICLRIK
jgi:hypothetical protein